MKPKIKPQLALLCVVASGLAATSTHTLAQAAASQGWLGTETIQTPSEKFDFKNGYPTDESAKRLNDALLVNRAVEVYLDQMPAVSIFQIRKGLADGGVREANQFAIWEALMDAKNLLLTGNSETVYGMSFLDLKRDGPTVIDAPPALLGGLSDMWQGEVVGIGPTGPDKGKGGKFLILPPDYEGTPPAGYMTAKSRTYGVWLGVRGFLVDGKTDKPVALMKSIKVYPLSQASHPPAMSFINGSGKDIDTVFPDTYAFYEDLAQLVEQEPANLLSPHERFQLWRPSASKRAEGALD